MKQKPRITIVVPCYGRPARTRRIINNILAQDICNWEAFVIGDGCPQFENMINSLEVDFFKKKAAEGGSTLHCFNLQENRGGFGAYIVDYAIEHATGEYFVFAGNDDIILPNHFSHYLSEIQNTDYDLVYYPTYVCPTNTLRIPSLEGGRIGHSELILRTGLIKGIKHTPEYGHDWDFIQQILSKLPKHKQAKSKEATYVVTHIHHFGQDLTCDNID
jgi:glycosyltransferase involved in cell wall biosynthesis